MKKVTPVMVTLLLLSLARYAHAAEWTLDKAHSKVSFSVAHLVISEVTGVFRDFDVTLAADKLDFTDAKIEATIETASIDTGNERRDSHLRTDDFLNVEKFPEMKFKSTKIEMTGADTYSITGDLTIRDSTTTVVLDTQLRGIIKGMGGMTTAAFKATATIDRFVFGVRWNKALETGGLIAGRDVTITLLMEFTRPL